MTRRPTAVVDGRGRRANPGPVVRLFLSVAVGAFAFIGSASALAKPSRPYAARARGVVTVTRDSAGIPHVLARDFRGLGYGDGYAFAQDNLCTLADQFITVEGQRSRYFGPNAMNLNFSAGAADSNLNSDLFWKYVQASHVVDRSLAQRPPIGPLPQVRQMYEGWAAGYDAFLRSGKLRDPRCKGKRWVHPITAMDLYLRGEQIVTEGSAQQFISDLVDAVPPGAGPRPPRRLAGLTFGRSRRSWAGLRTRAPAQMGSASGHRTPGAAMGWSSPTLTSRGEGPSASGWPS